MTDPNKNPLAGSTADFFGMPYNRYHSLQWTEEGSLTQEEIDAGWHWCYEWDDMLIHPNMPEYAHCTCKGNEELAKKAFDREAALSKMVDIGEMMDPFYENDDSEANENNDIFRKTDGE